MCGAVTSSRQCCHYFIYNPPVTANHKFIWMFHICFKDALDEAMWQQRRMQYRRRSSSDSKTRRRSISLVGIPTRHFHCLHYCCLEPHWVIVPPSQIHALLILHYLVTLHTVQFKLSSDFSRLCKQYVSQCYTYWFKVFYCSHSSKRNFSIRLCTIP